MRCKSYKQKRLGSKGRLDRSHLLLLRGSLSFVEPALPAAVDPETLLAHIMLVQIITDAALLATIPSTLVLAPIAPDEFSLAMALVLLELADVLLAVWPN